MTDDAKKDETPPTLEQKILEVLADHDYNGGAGMHWHPSKTPTDQAKTVAARITRMVSEHVDTAWEKPALDRLQELAEQRGYSRGFDIGWKAHENLPQPEAETKTMVRITYQFGVNGPRHATAQLHVDVDTTVQQLQDDVERTTGGLVGVTKVETREVTTASTPWVEVSAR